MHENDSIFSLFRFDTSVSNYICHGEDYSQLVIEEGQIPTAVLTSTPPRPKAEDEESALR